VCSVRGRFLEYPKITKRCPGGKAPTRTRTRKVAAEAKKRISAPREVPINFTKATKRFVKLGFVLSGTTAREVRCVLLFMDGTHIILVKNRSWP